MALSYDVCAIGNALVDIIADATDDWLQAEHIAKGGMTLIDTARAEALSRLVGNALQASGGSAGNTASGIASLGGKVAFMGKVADDALGKVFADDLRKQGVHFAATPNRGGTPTGRCIIMVTPDAQRSMNTYLGAADEFGPQDVQPEILRQSQMTYLEGYLFDPPQAQAAFRQAAKIVKAAGNKLALTLSDSFCVNRHRAAFLDLIKGETDILFANEHELMALFETADLSSALAQARTHCAIVACTRSAQGALIAAGNETITVKAAPVDKVIDTTGAGDLFAAGFLYGLTNGKNIEGAGRIAAIAAAEVIGHYGPRPERKLSELI